jgi:transposase
MSPPRYPSDLSDEEWIILAPLLSSTETRGRPPKWPLRHVADAVFYLLRSGCSWRMLPREYPPWQTVYYHFRKWRIDGRLRRAHDHLREARCASRKGARPTPARPSSTARWSRPPRWEGRNAATTGPSAWPDEKAPHPGGHGRSRPGCEGPRCRPTRSGRRQTIARGRRRTAQDGAGPRGLRPFSTQFRKEYSPKFAGWVHAASMLGYPAEKPARG